MKWRVDSISEKIKIKSEMKWCEVLQGSEGVHYFGNNIGDENYTVSSLVMRGEIKQ